MSRNVHPQWELIQTLYKSKFGTEPEVIDFIAVQDVLRLCCYGLTTEQISSELFVEEGYVISILEEYYNFSGWTKKMKIDLYSLYRSTVDFDDFENYLVNFASGNVKAESMRHAYDMCATYEKLKELLKDYE